jgi:hypothetical protein
VHFNKNNQEKTFNKSLNLTAKERRTIKGKGEKARYTKEEIRLFPWDRLESHSFDRVKDRQEISINFSSEK